MDVFIDPRFDEEYRRHPITLADIGARGGLKKNWMAARRHLRLLGFEPDKQEFARLSALTRDDPSGDRFFGVALHDRPGPLALHVARDRGLSSIFEPNRAFLDSFPDADRFDTVDRREVEADTLDRLLAAHKIDDLDFIKADTQGSELLVLHGAATALAASVIGVEVEVEFAPIYKGQPLFADVDDFLRKLGFVLFDLRPVYWKRAAGRAVGGPHGQIVWADALYLKGMPEVAETSRRLGPDGRKSKILRALSIAVLYGYVDYALEMAQAFGDLWSAEERGAIEARLRAPDSRHQSWPNFPGRRPIAAGLRQLWKRLRDRNDAWSVSDAEIGNLE